MSANSQQLNEELKRFQHTKNTFQTCERLLRTATFSGAECEQVASCIALIRFMIKETETTMKSLRETFKSESKSEEFPIPPAIQPETDLSLGAHLPEDK